MVNRMSTLGGLLKRIGNFDPSLFQSDFNARLILQKTIYLMQKFDLFIGYTYSYYLRGPYSPALTRDAYALLNEFGSLPLVEFANPEDEEHFKIFLAFVKPHVKDHAWLERAASILFHVRAYPHETKDAVFLKTKVKIRSLTRSEFDQIFEELNEVGLLKRRT